MGVVWPGHARGFHRESFPNMGSGWRPAWRVVVSKVGWWSWLDAAAPSRDKGGGGMDGLTNMGGHHGSITLNGWHQGMSTVLAGR